MTQITDLDDPTWMSLFTGLRSSWFRLETLQHYAVDYEADEYVQFQRTGTIDRPFGEWQDMIVRHVSQGRTLRRVHIIEHPRSSYLDYEVEAYKINARAGEDIRIIETATGEWPEGIPRGYDFWLFDDTDIWAMEYTPDGEFVAAQRVEDPSALEQHRQWRNRALALATPLAEYVTKIPTHQ